MRKVSCRSTRALRSLGLGLGVLCLFASPSSVASARSAVASRGETAARGEAAARRGGGPEGGDICGIVISGRRPTTIYVGFKSGGIFRSTNEGDSWMPAETRLPRFASCDLAVAPTDERRLYANVYGDLLRTTNGGEDWMNVSGVGRPSVTGLLVMPADADAIYGWAYEGLFRVDAAGTWSSFGRAGLPDQGIESIVPDPSDAAVLYAAVTHGMFKSTNGGRSWTAISRGLPPAFDVSTLAIDPASPRTLYASTNRGLFRSATGGDDWTAIGGTAAPTAAQRLVIDPSRPETMYALAGGDISKSVDAGRHWTAIGAALGAQAVQALAIDPVTPSTLYAGTSSGMFRSRNGGATWTPVNTGLARRSVGALAVLASNPTIVSMGLADGLALELTDSSARWTHRPALATTPDPRGIIVDPTDPARMYGVQDGKPMKSIDRGAHWLPMNLGQHAMLEQAPARAVMMDPHDPATLFVDLFFLGGLHRSRDRGETWERLGNAQPTFRRFLLFDPHTPGTIYLRTNGGNGIGDEGHLYKSTDRGEQWTHIALAAPAHTRISLATLIPSSPVTLLVAARNSSLAPDETGSGSIDYALLRSVDGGATWQQAGVVPTTTAVTSLVVDPKHPKILVLATDGNGVFFSRDGGERWRPAPPR